MTEDTRHTTRKEVYNLLRGQIGGNKDAQAIVRTCTHRHQPWYLHHQSLLEHSLWYITTLNHTTLPWLSDAAAVVMSASLIGQSLQWVVVGEHERGGHPHGGGARVECA